MFKNPTLRRLMPVLLLNLIAFAVAIPILPALTLEVGGTASDIGFLFALQAFGQFLMAPLWGDLSDRVGRKPVMVATIAGIGAFDLLTAAITSLTWLYPARLLTGMFAGNVATASAMIADATDPGQRSKGMAIVGISFGIGFTIGPAIAAGIAALPGLPADSFPLWLDFLPAMLQTGPGMLGTGLPFTVAGLMALATAVVAAFVLEEPPRPDTSSSAEGSRLRARLQTLLDHPRSRGIWLMCGLFFAFTVAVAVLEVTFFPFAEAVYGFNETEVGLIFAAMGLLMALVQGSVGRMSSRFGDRRMTGFGLILCAIGLAVAPIYAAPSMLWLFLLFVAVATIGRAFAHPGILSLTSGLSDDPAETGKIMGVLQSSASLGRIVGPALGGIIFDQFSPAAPFWAAAGLLVAAGLWWWRASRQAL